LSILVIVNFSITATCALYHFDLETEHSHGHIVEIQVTQLLTGNFAQRISDHRYFLD